MKVSLLTKVIICIFIIIGIANIALLYWHDSHIADLSAFKLPGNMGILPVSALIYALLLLFIIGSFIIIWRYVSQKQHQRIEQQKRRLIQEAQQKEEVKDRLDRIVNTAQIAFFLTVNGKVVEVNEYSTKYLGVKTGDNTINIYADPTQRQKIIEMTGGQATIVDVVRFNMLDGQIHRFLVNVSATEYQKNNAYILWGIDIEQDEVKNDQIRIMQQNLQSVLDALPIPVRIVDLQTNNIVYVNDSFLDFLEYRSADEICGQNIHDILPQTNSNGNPIPNLTEQMIPLGDLISFEVDYKTKHGRIIPTLLSTRHIEYKGRPSSIGIIKDLTAEKEHTAMLLNAAEKEKEANQAKSLFLANMSHEIRTPMNGIIGFSELALDENISLESKNDYLKKISASAEGLLQIINDILDISKIEAGRVELENIPFNIHDVFRMCQTIIMPKALEKGIILYCYAEPSIGKQVLGDPTRLRQVLLNLLSNAVKFTNVGTVKLLSNIIAATEDSVTMHFEVKDSGIGMDPEQLQKIFDPFMQADATTTRKYGGTGLGLSITKNIVEMMGGHLKVKSELGIGSKFSFQLTFKTTNVDEDDETRHIIINETQRPTFRGNILLFEDNPTNQQVIYDHLYRLGLKTIIAENGKIGVDIVRNRMQTEEKPFDLIFMDIHMPVMDGLEAAEKLAQIGNKTPIIALTANVVATNREIYRDHGMPDYLVKPFKAQELWTCLLKYLTPVDLKPVDIKEETAAEEKQRLQAQINFVKDNQHTYQHITEALEKGDIQLAHRLVHTLKGVAGLIPGCDKLVKAARAVEYILADGVSAPAEKELATLHKELQDILTKLAPLIKTAPTNSAPSLNKKACLALLNKLEPLLIANNTACLDYLDKVKEIPQATLLLEQIEAFEFKQAITSLRELKNNL